MRNKLIPFLAIAWFIFFGVSSQANEFEEGRDYRLIKAIKDAEATETESSSEGIIEVVEYFSYACVHCYRLEPTIKSWLSDIEEDIEFKRVAVPTRQNWIPLARAFLVAEELGITSKVHDLIFKAKFVQEKPIGSRTILQRMFVNEGEVTTEEFRTVYFSDDIANKMKETVEEMRDLGITVTPTVMVGNQYLVDAESAQGFDRMFEIVDHLVQEVRKEAMKTRKASPNPEQSL